MTRIKSFLLAWSALAVVALAASTPDAQAGCRRRARCAPVMAYGCYRTSTPYYGTSAPYYGSPATPQAAVYASPSAPAASTGNPTFLGWLNAVRARHGRRPVAWSDTLAAEAAINSARGFGHWAGTNPGRQNVGVGDLGSICSAWMASPAHASALLDPNISVVGLAEVNGIFTFNGM